MLTIYQENSLLQAFLSKSPNNGIELLNWLIDQMRSKRSIKVSIEFLSNLFKVDPRTIQRWLKKFKEWGIITKEQLYGPYSHNTITLNREIFKYAKYLKYQLASLWRYLAFVYLRPSKQVSVTPLIEEDVINTSISISITRESRKTPVFNTRGLKKQKEQEMRDIMEVSPPNISPILKEITDKLNLNKLGQLKLLVFHEQVLTDAWADYKKLGNVNHPFDYLVVNCIKKSESRSIPVYWDLFYTSCQRYGLTDNKVYISSKPKVDSVRISNYTVNRPHSDKTEPHKAFEQYKFGAITDDNSN